MKPFIQSIPKKEKARIAFNWIVLVIFIGYGIYVVIQQTDLWAQIGLSVLLVGFAAFYVLNEALNLLYLKAIFLLTTVCDPTQALSTMATLKKYDILRGYPLAHVAFQSLAAEDLGDADQLLALFADEAKLPTSSKDIYLIKAYSTFRAYVLKGNKTQTKKAYTELIKLKELKVKGKGFSPLYAWFDIEAEFALIMGDVKEAASILSKADTRALNPREMAHHQMLVARVETARGNTEQALSACRAVIAGSNGMAIKAQAETLMKEITHEATQKPRR
jgi:hypothetical protein